MKIFSFIKGNENKKIKILGLPLYVKNHKSAIGFTEKKVFCGILKGINDSQTKKYYIAGIKVFTKFLPLNTSELARKIKNEIIAEERALLSVYNLHSKVFPKFRNCNLNKDLIIVGCGPTANFYSPCKNGLIHIGLNKAFKIKSIKFDYLFFVDKAHKGDSFKETVSLDCVKFFGFHCNPEFSYCNDSILYNDKNIDFCLIPDEYVIKNNAFRFYSNAHRNEIFPDIETSPLMDFGSVVFPALHFALYTHPKRIFLVGCDCANNGYFNNEKQPLWNDKMLNRTFYGFNKLKKFISVYYPDIEIISVNPVGLKTLFKDVYTRKYVDEHPELKNSEISYFENKIKEA